MISGASGNDVLVGGVGKDQIVGSAGDDILVAGDTDCRLVRPARSAVEGREERSEEDMLLSQARISAGQQVHRGAIPFTQQSLRLQAIVGAMRQSVTVS